MSGFVYILRTKNNKYYIGSTIDIDRRIIEHNSGKTKSLKYLLPVCLCLRNNMTILKLQERLK